MCRPLYKRKRKRYKYDDRMTHPTEPAAFEGPSELVAWPSAPAIRVYSADEMLEHAVSLAGLGAFFMDWQTASARVTPRLRELFGWTPDQTLTIQDLAARVHPVDRERLFTLIDRPEDMDRDPSFSIDFRIVLPGGGRSEEHTSELQSH